MSNANTPSAELLAELEVLRSRVRELEHSENERRCTEEALQESEERVRRMGESLPIVLFSVEAGRRSSDTVLNSSGRIRISARA